MTAPMPTSMMPSPMMPSPIAALRASLSAAKLLGFAAENGAADGGPLAKAAFVGINQYDVTSTADDGSAGTLRSQLAAEAQNEMSSNNFTDQIVFDPSIANQTITLQSSLTITAPVVITGNTATGVNDNITISGNNAVTDFTVASANGGQAVEIDNLTIANGTGTGAAGTNGATNGISSINGGPGGDAAGGIFVQSGNLNLNSDSFTNDTATGGAGGNAGFTGSMAQTKGAGGTGGNAAGAVYVEAGATVGTASAITATSVSGTGGTGGGAAPDGGSGGAAGTGSPVSNNATIQSAAATATACYCTGVLIRVVRDGAEVDVAVERLVVGDLAVTSTGARRPIRWIGSRVTPCRAHPRPHEVLPVRVAAHAFGAGRPARDLLVSPGHALCLDLLGEVLVPAATLVNGTTITREDVDSVTYWHVELDSHDVLLAENTGAESYLDVGNRAFFAQGAVVDFDATPDLMPDAAPDAGGRADFCRPLHGDGPLLDVARAQLRHRAAALGWTLEEGSDPFAGLHLLVDGARVEPVIRGLAARFQVPAGAGEAWLVSRTARPCDFASSTDSRDLGVCVAGLTIGDGFEAARAIALGGPLLGEGFHGLEDGVRRWTAGRARLPAGLWADAAHDVFLRVDLAGPALPRWIAPAGGIAATSTVALFG